MWFCNNFLFIFLLKLGQSGQVTLTFALRHTAWKLQTWGGSSLNYSHNLVFPPFALLMSVLVILVLWSLHVRDAWGRVASLAEEVALTYVGQGVGWCLCRTLPPQGERREGGVGVRCGHGPWCCFTSWILTLLTASLPTDQPGQAIDYAYKYNYSPVLFESWQIAQAKALVQINFLLRLA